ncbi:MAG: amidohydrolase family protein [Gammaproteobacteria bacterium]|jgi:5-methylthioadenosine/S-adenosylhomocysteine deaminase|nr:amidohydrolase family protein [Gammaproteobacteria bacterium]
MAQSVDLLVLHAHLLTMQGNGVGYLRDGALAVRGDSLVDVGRSSELAQRYQATETLDATNCAVMPGLVDVHMHTVYAIVRGVAQDVSNWMQKGLAPFARHMDAEAARAGTRLNIVEAMQAGTTTMGDFVRPYPGWGECYAEAGVRACLTPTINALPPGGMAGLELGDLYPLDEKAGRESIAAALAICDRWQGAEDGRITTMLGPQGTDMIGLEQLLEVARIAEERGLMLHVHVAQGDREIDQMVKRYGQRTPAFLADNKLLNDRLLAVHLTEATDEETDLIAESGAPMALCSGSIGIIDGIVPPARRFREKGGIVGLGSDQASGNNCNNIFNEMKLTALFNKIKYRDPQVMPAWEVLRMGTIEGARAMGLGDRIGSLEVGKQADLIVVDVNTANILPIIDAPVRTLVPNLIYAGTGKEVQTMVVAGRIVMRDREILTLSESKVRAEAQHQAELIGERVSQDPLHRELALLSAMQAGQL